MISKTIVMVLLLVSGVVFAGYSQERFTLEQAISAALEHNHSIRVESIEAVKADRRVSRGYAGLLPNVGITGQLEQTYGSVELAPGSFFRDLIGGQLGDQPGNQVPAIPSSIRYDGISSTSTMAGLGGQMVIYDGGKGQIRYSLLQTASDAAGLQHRHRMEETILEITQKYAETALLQESLNLQQEILRQGYDRYRIKQEQSRYGQTSEQELLQAQADLKSDSTDYRDLQNRFETSYRELHQTIGWKERPPVELEADLPVATREELLAMTDEARQRNTRLELNRRQVEMSDYELQLSESDVYPRLLASAQLGHRYEYVSEGQFESRKQWGLTGGLTLQMPLFEGGRRSVDRQNARASVRQSEIRRQEAERQLETELENSLSRFKHLEEELQTLRDDLHVYERNFERAHQTHRQGLITGIELRQAQLGLMSARLQISELQLQLKLTETVLMYTGGRLIVENY